MAKFRTTNKKYLAARIICSLVLGAYLVGGYSSPVAWGAGIPAAQIYEDNGTEDPLGRVSGNSGKVASAWGVGATASGNGATAWGGSIDEDLTLKGGMASGLASTAFGVETVASSSYSTAWGVWSKASNNLATAWGVSTRSTGISSTAWGAGTLAIDDRSTAFGYSTQAGQLLYGTDKIEATIERYTKDGETKYRIVNASDWSDLDNNEGTGFASYEDAYNDTDLTKVGAQATAFGNGTKASGEASTAFGLDTTASGDYSTAFGTSSLAYGRDSTAFGNMSKASGVDSTAFGAVTEAIGDRSTAFGYGTQAGRLLYGEDKTEALIRRYKDGDIYKYKIVDANNTSTTLKEGFASYEAAFKAEGLTKTGDRATAFGQSTKATGLDSTAFGWETTASGDGSTAFGQKATASGYYSTAFGYNTTAGGHYSAAWGSNSVASGSSSTAFGISSEAKAKNSLAALGGIVETGGENSAAIGKGAKVTVADAVALGSGSVADTANTISVGSSSLQRKIVNVAAGTADTDAVNLKQLSDKLDKTEFNTYKADTAVTISTMNGAIAGLDGRVTAAENAIPVIQQDISDLQTGKLDKAVYEADKADTKAVLDGKANVALDNITEDGKTVIKDLAKGAVNVVGEGPVSVAKSDVSGVDTYTVSVKTDGKVEDSNTGIVTGGTVYNEVRPTDGNYVMAANTTAANLTALDIEVKANADAIGATADGNYVSSTDSVGANLNTLDNQVNQNAKDIKANTDSINGLDSRVTQNTNDIADLKAGTGADLTAVNHRIDNLDSKINKVGAGAAALAALHPLDTDNKFTMAAGFGNYRNANAMALGMFYRPTDKVMFSVGGAMGNGENMINAGVSFALDKGVGTSKAAMARKIQSLEGINAEQATEIQSLKAENAKLAERLAAIEAKLAK